MAVRISRRQYVWGAVGAVVVLAGVVVLLKPSTAAAKDPEGELVCSSDKRVQTFVTSDETIDQPKSPDELATEWKNTPAAHGQKSLGERSTYIPSDGRQKIGFKDSKGSMVAVIVFEKREKGWHIDHIVECG